MSDYFWEIIFDVMLVLTFSFPPGVYVGIQNQFLDLLFLVSTREKNSLRNISMIKSYAEECGRRGTSTLCRFHVTSDPARKSYRSIYIGMGADVKLPGHTASVSIKNDFNKTCFK